MKFSTLSAIFSFANAKVYRICDADEYSRSCIPESLLGQWDPRYTIERRTVIRRGRERTIRVKVGSDAYTREEIAALDEECRSTVQAFDKYCHQYKFRENLDVEEGTVDVPKYADFRLEDGTCDHQEDAASLMCLYQQCMFDYCLYRRDDWVADCRASVAAGTDVEPRPKWGAVYSYRNMRDALQDGSFGSDTCVDYFSDLSSY